MPLFGLLVDGLDEGILATGTDHWGRFTAELHKGRHQPLQHHSIDGRKRLTAFVATRMDVR